MLPKRSGVAVVCLALAGALDGQQPAPTPPEQHVVAPSLPDQKNSESTVRPSGAMRTDAAGWVVTGSGQCPGRRAPQASARGAAAAPAPAPQGAVQAPPAAGPSGPAVVETAHITLRGTVKAYEPRKSITIVEASGRERIVPLAPKASVYEGARAGDKVCLRIPLQGPGDGKSADRIERQKTTAPPKSKFSQAQSPSN
ncbi:MAG: hypothetical protein ACM3JH_00075 [Acidithiobacillales bacterium]